MNTNKTQTEQLTQDAVMQSVLKANDLRIGNLIFYQTVDLNTGKNVLEIVEATANDIKTQELKPIFLPIPLTEDWLLKFDFYVSDVFGQKQYFLSGITIYVNDGKFQHSGYDREIKYVHELQNLYFALTQRELTVA